MEKIKELYKKYEEIIVYLIVGVMTTIVSWAAKFIANALLFDNTMYPTPVENAVLSTINWTTGVIFAFPGIHVGPGYCSHAGVYGSQYKSCGGHCDCGSTGDNCQLCFQQIVCIQ